MDRFDVLAALKPNWDSYGGIPPDALALAKAKDLFWRLPGRWLVIPGGDGSVQLEQHSDGLDIEVHISAAPKSTGESGD